MGCKSSKIIHDEPCSCQHAKQVNQVKQQQQAKQAKQVNHDHIVVVRSPSPASSFYNSNSSTYSSESTYSNSDESSAARRPFLCDHPSHHSEHHSEYEHQTSRPRMRKETSGKSYKNKPLPRRNRSGREVKVFAPKSTLSQRRRRSIEANRDREKEPQEPRDPAPWAMTEHNKLVPIIQPINRLNITKNAVAGTTRPTFELEPEPEQSTAIAIPNAHANAYDNGNGNGLSLRKNRMPTPKRGAPASDYIVTGGYVVSPEVYYASLPLPSLPPPRHSEPAPVSGANRAKRDEVIHEQLRQNAEIVQARRVKEKEYTSKKMPNRF